MWEKCATSIECKTIRIAESSVMDSWEVLPRSMSRVLSLKTKWSYVATILKGRYEFADEIDHKGYGQRKEEFLEK